jgi:predicted secreted Zn-dependent protease
MKLLWKYYSAGIITKEDLDATLRTHQASIDATRSAQRDAAEASGLFSLESLYNNK